MIRSLQDIVDVSRNKGRKRLVVAYAQDAHTLQAVHDAVAIGLVEATLLGDPEIIGQVCGQEGIDTGRFTIVPETNDNRCVTRAVQLVSSGEGEVLMKGLVSTDKYMRGILSKEYGLLPPKGVLSHVVVFQMPQYHKLLLASDVAVIPYPDLAQKRAIAKYLVHAAHVLGIERPKIALIAPSEQVLPAVASSAEAAILSKMGDRGQLGNAVFDGPLSLDVALFEEVARVKKVQGSGVAGEADCLLFPNIDAANVFFKSATKLCGAELAALVVGTKAPCVLTSRGDSKSSKLYSIALACLAAQLN